ncbi:DUF4030 domain-containing protein [Bacillus massilinigeriensis]|uniref:DUF4030 domain-containing protein n=1 Tax=Bacillus massilionigeriensis TaxID=1805475 RepID=UPI00096B4B5A|nr:DUF4030 domain-containing protein [Bacillus massilionigeriensis]
MKKPFEDKEFEESLRKMETDLLWKKSQKQELKDRILKDIEGIQWMEENKSPVIASTIRKQSIGRRLAYTGAVLAVLFGLFIGTTFFSPAMAEVAAKIPYLNKVFQLKPLNEVLWEKLQAEGYKIETIGGSAREISISIGGSDAYYNEVRGKVKEIAEGILESREYDAYKVKVIKSIERMNESTPISDRDQAIQDTMMEIQKELEKLDVNVLAQGYGYSAPNTKKFRVQIDVPNTETRDEVIKQIINQKFEEKNLSNYSIDIKKIDLVQRERESKWDRVFPTIIEGLTAKKEYKVTGFAYSFHPAPLQIIIKTSIESTDKDAAERAAIIEETIEEFLHSEEIKSEIEGEPYQIIIRSKDKKHIN